MSNFYAHLSKHLTGSAKSKLNKKKGHQSLISEFCSAKSLPSTSAETSTSTSTQSVTPADELESIIIHAPPDSPLDSPCPSEDRSEEIIETENSGSNALGNQKELYINIRIFQRIDIKNRKRKTGNVNSRPSQSLTTIQAPKQGHRIRIFRSAEFQGRET